MGCASSMPPAIETSVKDLPSVAEPSQNDFHEEAHSKDFHDKYILGLKLGRGAFGQVRVAIPAGEGKEGTVEEKAVKIVELRDAEDAEKISETRSKASHAEASMWQRATHHPNIVHLEAVFHDPQFYYFVMEKCVCGLFEYLENYTELTERSVGHVFAQMLHGIAHVHSVGIVHRDIKAENFLIGGSEGSVLKLCDFGLSAIMPSCGKLRGLYGTPVCMSPEMLKGEFYDMKTDVWSMGVLAYALLFGNLPYSSEVKSSRAMKQAIVLGKPPKFLPVSQRAGDTRSDGSVTFARSLLDRDVVARPGAEDALKLSYMGAISHNDHLIDFELPSLRPMLYSSKKEGVFELRDLTKRLDCDILLDDLQRDRAHWGETIPNAQPMQFRNVNVDRKLETFVPTSSCSHSYAWSKVSSFATTASGETVKIASSSSPSLVSVDLQ